MKKIFTFFTVLAISIFGYIGNAKAAATAIMDYSNYIKVCEYSHSYSEFWWESSQNVGIYFDIESNNFVAVYFNDRYYYAAPYRNEKPVYHLSTGLNSNSTICPENGYVDTAIGWNPTKEVCFDDNGKYCTAGLKEGIARDFRGTSEKIYDINDAVSSALSNYQYDYAVPSLSNLENLNIDTIESGITNDMDQKLLSNLRVYYFNSESKISNLYNFIRNTEAYKNTLLSQIEKVEEQITNELNSRLNDESTTETEKSEIRKNLANIETVFNTYIQNFNTENEIPVATEDSCVGYLGSLDNPNAPAYYLHHAFNIIKYGAIVLLFALTVVEYAKAIVSSDQDIIKKATQKTIKRIIIAVIIFVLPTLIEFILNILGITGYGTCNI